MRYRNRRWPPLPAVALPGTCYVSRSVPVYSSHLTSTAMRTTSTLFSVLAILSALAVSPASGQGRSLGIPPSACRGKAMPTWRSTTSIRSRPIPTPPRRSWTFGTWRCRGARRKRPSQAYSDCPGQTMDRGIQGPARAVHQGQSRSAGSDPGGGPLVGRAGHGGPVQGAAGRVTLPTRRPRPNSWPMPARSSKKSGRGSCRPIRPRSKLRDSLPREGD